MKSRHWDAYGTQECAAYLELAKLKWDREFVCRRDTCKHTRFYEGATPYSRRCQKCKHDESVKAHTAFDKMRMPLSACLEIVRTLAESEEMMTVEAMTSYLVRKSYSKINSRSVWLVMKKAFETMHSPKIVFDTQAIFILFLRRHYGIIISQGICDGQVLYDYAYRGTINIDDYIRSVTDEKTKVVLCSVLNLKSSKGIKCRAVNERSYPQVEEADIYRLARELSPWSRNPEYLRYRKNGHSYEELITAMVRK